MGKTGTAQKYENGAIAKNKYIASFLGFAPVFDPDYILLVIIDEPQGAYYGGTIAAPVAGRIFERIFETKGVETNSNLEADRKALEANILLPNLTGMTLTQAVQELNALGLQYLIQGNGKRVSGQISPPGTYVCVGDVVLLIFD
ncbi:MAG: PASTA domain-containing protein [Clostridia bacterium]|nr:PASTA domain-containing protein [Clostridia bacterium]